jgi:hypothetical protein
VGWVVATVPVRIFSRGFGLGRRVATAVDRTAEREDCLGVEREGRVPTANRATLALPPLAPVRVQGLRTSSIRQDALRQDIVPPLPGAS